MYSVAHYGEQFLSTPSARRATGSGRVALRSKRISIHALREEGDANRMELELPYHQFLSTPSARRATYFFFIPSRLLWISIHALREEGDLWGMGHVVIAAAISIHALREEGDRLEEENSRQDRHFYPRPPRGGRLCKPVTTPPEQIISIHALREEGDYSYRISSQRSS